MSQNFNTASLAIVCVCMTVAGRTPAQPNTEDALEQIIVYGARQPIEVRRSGSSVTLLDDAGISLDGRLTVGEQLRGLPGIALSRSGGQGALTQLRMRGGEANHVAVFVDGVRVNDPSQSGEFDFAHLLSQGLDRVEIVRGPQSALWGSDALSGVINVISERPVAGWQADALAESGSDGWSRIGGGAGGAGERGSFAVNAARVHTDGYNVARSGTERDGYENTSLSFRGLVHLAENVDLSLNMLSIDARSDFDGTDFSTGLPADRLNTIDKDQLISGLRLSADAIDGRWRHEVRLDRFDTQNISSTQNAFAASGFDEIQSSAIVDSLIYQSSFDLTDVHRLTGALERRNEKFIQRGPVTFGDPNRDEYLDADSIVVEYDVRPAENLSFLISWRSDRNSQFADTSTRRVSGSWQPGNGRAKLRAAWGEGVKNPTFTERFGFFTSFIGNASLVPERSESKELGIDYSFVEAQLRLSATLFDETLEDEINGFVFDVASGGFTARNQTGESRRRGVELAAAWNPGDMLSLQFSWTGLDAEEVSSAGAGPTREIRRPAQTASLSLNWRALADRFNLAASLAYSSDQDDFFFPPVPPYQERVTLESFSLLTLSAEYELTPQLRIYGRVENALDEEYEEVFGFRSAARQFFLGLKYGL